LKAVPALQIVINIIALYACNAVYVGLWYVACRCRYICKH